MGKPTIVYNVETVPEELTLDVLIKIFKETGFIIWSPPRYFAGDEDLESVRPQVYDAEGAVLLQVDREVNFKDLSKEEIVELINLKNGKSEKGNLEN